MAMNMPPAIVSGAPREGHPFGLFSVLVPREGRADRFENGVTWEALTCAEASGIGSWDCDTGENEGTIGLPKTLDQSPERGDASEFTVYGHSKCSPVGYSFSEAQERATAHLVAREERRVEQALWTGDLGNEPNLTDDPEGLGTFALAEGIAELEAALAEGYGSLGVIHASRRNASLLISAGLVEARSGRLHTGLGTPVVAGGGYGDELIVASPALFGYRSEVFHPNDTPVQLFDTSKNNLYAVAERTYVVGFDPCGVWAFTPESTD